MTSYYDRAFRGWVTDSSAKDRAFAGWIEEEVAAEIRISIDVSLAAPVCVMQAPVTAPAVPEGVGFVAALPPRRIDARIEVSLAAPTCEMQATVVDLNYASALAELDPDLVVLAGTA